MSLRRIVPVLLAVALALTACGEPGVTLEDLESLTESPSPSASILPSPSDPPATEPAMSAAATPSASPTVAAGAGLDVDGLAEVVVTNLVVRSAPGVDPATSTILAERLTSGDRAFVVDGPVDASGYAWYLVAPLLRADDSAGPFGWIAAASRDGDVWVRPIEPPCPATADLPAVLALQPLERLSCFGGETLTLSAGEVACGAGGGPWSVEPSWIGVVGGCALVDGDRSLLVRIPPDGTALGPGPITVRGHFDDPAAATCTIVSHDASVPAPTPEHAVVMCRTEFVREG